MGPVQFAGFGVRLGRAQGKTDSVIRSFVWSPRREPLMRKWRLVRRAAVAGVLVMVAAQPIVAAANDLLEKRESLYNNIFGARARGRRSPSVR